MFPESCKNSTFGTFFGCQLTKLLKIGICFPPQEKISQNKISLFFFRFAGHIFTIQAVLRSQLGYTAVSGEKKFRRSLELFRSQVCKKVLGAISRFMCPQTKLFAVEFRRILDVFV